MKFYGYFIPSTQEKGIVKTWDACKKKTEGVRGAKFKRFPMETAAQAWLDGIKNIEGIKVEKKQAKDKTKKASQKECTILVAKPPKKVITDFAYEIYFDGACEPNNQNGTASYGWLIKKDGKVIEQDCAIIGKGENITNNVAEYTGLLKALERFDALKLSGAIMIRGDSKLVCNMVARDWGWKDNKTKTKWIGHKDAPHLATLLEQVHKLLEAHDHAVQWVPREQNQEADDLSKKPLIEAGIIKPDSESKKCPECGANLVLRSGKYGKFFGCSRYPKCKHTEKSE